MSTRTNFHWYIPRRTEQQAQCDGKWRYESDTEAQAALDLFQQQGREQKSEVYACPACHGWHLGCGRLVRFRQSRRTA